MHRCPGGRAKRRTARRGGGGHRGGVRVGSRGGGAAALPCSRAHLPLPPGPVPVLSAGAGRRRGREVPACIRRGGEFLPRWRAPRGREGKYRAFRPGGRAGRSDRRPPRRRGGPGKSLGACQEHSAHNNLAENTAASASRNPGLAQSPAARASLGPTQCTHQPWGFFPLFPLGSCTWPSSMKRRH